MQARIAAALGGTLLGLTVISAAPAGQTPAPAPAPTFTKDVAPILYTHCASCHRRGEMAPMSLLTYEDARPYARAIRTKVASGQMPPWHADAPAGTFLNDRRLSPADKETLVRWAAAGAPQGDAKDLPPLPTFSDGWEIGQPDAVIAMPAAYDVPASGKVSYQYFEAPTKFTEDKWVQALEIRAGARAVVHHVLVFSREPNATARPQPFKTVVPAPPPPREPASGLAARPEGATGRPATPVGQGRGVLIATTAPGTNALTFQPGTALQIKAGSILTFQIHYTASGQPTRDQSSIGFVFAKQPPQQEVRMSAFMNARLKLPAGASDTAVDAAILFSEDAHITALFPHTHLRGTSWAYRLVYPDGRSEVVLSVPRYDFNWQTYYQFAQPISVPKGARLESTAHYDNSDANRSNPDPTIDVKWGEQTWEEMQYSGITYTVDSQRRASTTGQRQH